MPKSESIDVSPENDDQIEWEFGNLSLSNARNKPLNTQSFWPLLRNDCVLTFKYKQKKNEEAKRERSENGSYIENEKEQSESNRQKTNWYKTSYVVFRNLFTTNRSYQRSSGRWVVEKIMHTKKSFKTRKLLNSLLN